MRQALVASLVFLFFIHAPGARAGEFDNCVQCHREAVQAFSQSAMSQTATTRSFEREWAEKGNDQDCLACHAPSGGQGIQCRDCHGLAEHPVDKVGVPGVCARCHSAPGETTVHMYLASRSFKDGRDCIDCHSGKDGENVHRFKGPNVDGFLIGVARIRAGILAEQGRVNALIRISHRAGHSLPGGTTGRAVWLVAEGMDDQGQSVWSKRVRFGWVHDGRGNWRDETLRPDTHTQVRLENIRRSGAVRLRVALFYQFAAGDFDAVPGSTRRALDQVELEIPDDLRRGGH